jgi:hypothetical protein
MTGKTDRPANDAHLMHLVQFVHLLRGVFGRDARTTDLPRVNVSSRERVVTLHGDLDPEQRRAVYEVACGVSGVEKVVSKL